MNFPVFLYSFSPSNSKITSKLKIALTNITNQNDTAGNPVHVCKCMK